MKARLAMLAAGVLLLAACDRKVAIEAPVPTVLVQQVVLGAPGARDVYSGEIRARHETDLAFRVGGKIVARSVDAGATVRRGQELARLDPSDARLALQAASAQSAAAEGDLALAEAELERHSGLLAQGFISRSALDARRNARDAAAARAAQMRSQRALSANQAGYTSLVADADGVVVSVAAEPGQVVAAGQPVLRLARAGEMDVVLHAPEGQLARFAVGRAVTISLWADRSAAFAGRIREIAGGADPITRTYLVRVGAIDPPPTVRLGMSASVLLGGGGDERLVLLPLSALARSGAEPAVWVVDAATGLVALRPVAIGQFREDGVTITSGLAAGELVVTAGVRKLRPGQRVRHVASL
jgi:multidrug efflux system membrane fusion protein